MTKTKKVKNESSGGYMSVDRTEAIKANWDTIQNMSKPSMNNFEFFTKTLSDLETTVYPEELDINSPAFLRQT